MIEFVAGRTEKALTVSQLIERLQKLPPDRVLAYDVVYSGVSHEDFHLVDCSIELEMLEGETAVQTIARAADADDENLHHYDKDSLGREIKGRAGAFK